MKKVLLFIVLAMVAVGVPLTAMGDLMRPPPSTEIDLLGNISLDGSGLLFLGGKQNIVSVYTFGNDVAWDQFGLGDVNWGKYAPLGHGTFEVANLDTYNWGDPKYGKAAITFSLNFPDDIGSMVTSLGDYNFDILGNRNIAILSNFEPVHTDPVPEPATFLLFATGLAGLIGANSMMERKKKSDPSLT